MLSISYLLQHLVNKTKNTNTERQHVMNGTNVLCDVVHVELCNYFGMTYAYGYDICLIIFLEALAVTNVQWWNCIKQLVHCDTHE